MRNQEFMDSALADDDGVPFADGPKIGVQAHELYELYGYLVRCLHCGTEWSVSLVRDFNWWTCPNGCNVKHVPVDGENMDRVYEEPIPMPEGSVPASAASGMPCLVRHARLDVEHLSMDAINYRRNAEAKAEAKAAEGD